MNFASKIPVLRSFARAYALTKFKKEWRKRNKQNRTNEYLSHGMC